MANKFNTVQDDVFSVFASGGWVAEAIPTYPVNFIIVKATEYIRVSVVASGRGINLVSTSGQVLIDIFIAAGKGPSRGTLIADKLDSYLVGKTLKTGSGSTQFSEGSALTTMGQDKDNPALFRMIYSISFNYFGA
jgi:hypothetical protein